MFAASELPSAKTPSRDIHFHRGHRGRSPQNAAIPGELSEPRRPARGATLGLFPSLSAHFLRRNRTTAILVRMSNAR